MSVKKSMTGKGRQGTVRQAGGGRGSHRKGLGRGLDALISVQDPAPASVSTLEVGRLRPNRRQPRQEFDDESLSELASSIRAQGVVQPIVVTPEEDGTYGIVAGERRWRAAQRAGLAEVPVVVRPVATDRELLELALVENLQRSDLNPLEEAEAYQALQEEFGLKQDEVAARVGKTRPAISNALRLLRLPGPIQDMMRDGRLTAGQARPLLALESPDRQAELAERALREGLNARQIEAAVRQPAKPGTRRKSPPPQEAHAAAAEQKLTQRLQTKVEIRRRGKGGQVRIHFYSESELIRLFDHLMKAGDTP